MYMNIDRYIDRLCVCVCAVCVCVQCVCVLSKDKALRFTCSKKDFAKHDVMNCITQRDRPLLH